jgi:hypothetical protein
MHIIRSTMGDCILDETNLPRGIASLMIGHEIPGDHNSELDRVGQTGKRWYFQAQRPQGQVETFEPISYLPWKAGARRNSGRCHTWFR